MSDFKNLRIREKSEILIFFFNIREKCEYCRIRSKIHSNIYLQIVCFVTNLVKKQIAFKKFHVLKITD